MDFFLRPNVVLGVTNPFFIKTFQNWPHIVRLGEIKMSGKVLFLFFFFFFFFTLFVCLLQALFFLPFSHYLYGWELLRI